MGPSLRHSHCCASTLSNRVLVFFLVLICWTPFNNVVEAWPYVDCSATNSIFALQQVTAHYDHGNNSIGLTLQGNFTDTYWAQGYSEQATLKWRTSIQTTIMGTQLYRSEGPACMADGGMIIGGCPTGPGLGTIQTSFNISQAAPFAELMVTMQIVGSNNQSIVCVAVLLEQTMETVNNAVSFLPLALACLSGAISLTATFMRASVGNGFLGAAATYGMATEPISVHTPGFFDVIFYTQFMLMTGQLSVNYPSFYATFTALFHWSFLEFRDTLLGKGPANATEVLTFGGAGSVNQIQDSRAGSNRGGTSIITPTTTTTAPITTAVEGPRNPRKRDLSYDRHGEQELGYFIGQDLLPLVWTAQTASTFRVTIVDTRTAARVYVQPTLPAKRQIGVGVGPDETGTASQVTPTSGSSVSAPAASNIQHNVSRFGIEAYAAAIGAFPSSLFLGTLLNAVLAMIAALLLSGGFLGIAWMMAKEKHQRGKTLQHSFNFVAGSSELLLFDDLGTLLKYGPLYNTLAQEGTLFFLVTLLVRFLWGLAVAMLPTYGVAQVAVLLVIELGYTLVIGVKWPFSESTDNKFHLFLGIIRIVITGLSIGYIHEVEGSPELRELLAYIQMSLHLAVFIVMFALTLWNLIQACMFWHTRHSDTWKGPTKTYSFEDPSREMERGWGLNGQPFLHSGATHSRGVAVSNNDNRASGEGDDDDDFGAGKNRRFTVMSYSSLGSSNQGADASSRARRESMQHALHAQMRQQHHESSDDETLRYGSPAERYRQSRLGDHRQSAFNPSTSSETGTVAPDSGYMGPVLLSSAGVGSGVKGGATSPSSDTGIIDPRQSWFATA
ncbi:hypothetical protein BGZ97_001726 [Linnemannia gamsii]|uniref:TRP C-terminal domain-containing protein n=1 Tax=Linnemannia gamsii TaxID=64522 RepID=A0A9P6QXZ0_9FUNG|nr:hypothetical protein BGZ97_001726 [Linnemannia gamsii]